MLQLFIIYRRVKGNPYYTIREIYTGIRASKCYNPCTSTQSKVSVLDERPANYNLTWISFAIDQTVQTTEYYFPEFSVSDFLSSLGGSLGLWLGVGVVQIGGYARIAFEKIRSFIKI